MSAAREVQPSAGPKGAAPREMSEADARAWPLRGGHKEAGNERGRRVGVADYAADTKRPRMNV